jgi:hypothetical protein
MKAMTTKQREIMKVVVRGNLDASGTRVSDVDVYQIMSRVPYESTRESMMCSLAILKKQGWIIPGGKEMRDGRMKQTLAPTAVAIRVVTPPKPAHVPVYVESEEDDVVLLELT